MGGCFLDCGCHRLASRKAVRSATRVSRNQWCRTVALPILLVINADGGARLLSNDGDHGAWSMLASDSPVSTCVASASSQLQMDDRSEIDLQTAFNSRSAYDACTELLGLKGIVVRDPEKLGVAWDEAFNADRPVIMAPFKDIG